MDQENNNNNDGLNNDRQRDDSTVDPSHSEPMLPPPPPADPNNPLNDGMEGAPPPSSGVQGANAEDDDNEEEEERDIRTPLPGVSRKATTKRFLVDDDDDDDEEEESEHDMDGMPDADVARPQQEERRELEHRLVLDSDPPQQPSRTSPSRTSPPGQRRSIQNPGFDFVSFDGLDDDGRPKTATRFSRQTAMRLQILWNAVIQPVELTRDSLERSMSHRGDVHGRRPRKRGDDEDEDDDDNGEEGDEEDGEDDGDESLLSQHRAVVDPSDNPTSGFAFPAAPQKVAEFTSDELLTHSDITIEDLMFLLDDTYQLWCAGSMNPFERIVRAFNIRVRCGNNGQVDEYVTSEDAAAYLGSLASRVAAGHTILVGDPTIDIYSAEDEEEEASNEQQHPQRDHHGEEEEEAEDGEEDGGHHNIHLHPDAFDQRLLSDMFARSMHDTTIGVSDGSREQTCLLTSDVVLNAFRRFIFCVHRLRQAFVILYDGHQPTTLHNGYEIAFKFKAILARLQDLQNLYILTCATARESCSTIGYKEFMQLPNVWSLLPHLFHYERSNTLLDAEYRYNMERMISDQAVNAPPHADMGLMDDDEEAPPPKANRAYYHEPSPTKTAEFNELLRTPMCAYEIKERYILEMKDGRIPSIDLLEGGNPLDEQDQSDLAMFESADGPGAVVASSASVGGGDGQADEDGGSGRKKKKRQSAASISRQVMDAPSVISRRRKALFQHILFLFSHHGLVQHPEKRTILAPVFNSRGIFTRAYHDLTTARGEPMTVEAMVYCLFNTLVNSLMFHIADPTGMCLTAIVKAFSQMNDPQFPIHNPNRCIISFDDGLLCVPTCRFYPFSQLASAITPDFVKSLYHVAGNMRSVAGIDFIRTQLQQEQQLLMQGAACCYIPRPMGPAFGDLMKRLQMQIEIDVLDVLYPIRSKRECVRLRAPTPSSPDKVFHLYVDLITVKFREFIEKNPTIYDTTFLWQIGIDTRRMVPSTTSPGKLVQNPNFMRRLANPVVNSAARKLEQMIQQDLQAASLAMAQKQQSAPTSDDSGGVLEPHQPQPQQPTTSEDDVRSEISKTLNEVRGKILEMASRLLLLSEEEQGAHRHLSDALEQLVDKMDAVKEKVDNTTTTTTQRHPKENDNNDEREEEEEDGEEVEDEVEVEVDRRGRRPRRLSETEMGHILKSVPPNDRDAMRKALTPEMEAFTKQCNESPEHQAYRALLIVFMILGTYFVPRDKHLGLDLPIAVWLRGIAGSGKTKALDCLIRIIYGDSRIAIINNNIEKEFGFAPLLESSYYVGIAHDFQGSAFPFDIYQQLVTDGKMRVPRKNVSSYEVKVNLKPCFCCNRLPRWPNQGATKDSPGAFTRRSLVVPFMVPLHESLSDADYDQRVQEHAARILAMLALARKLLGPTFSVMTFWKRSSRVVNMWRLDAEATLMPFEKFVHELGIFEFNAMAIIADVDMRVLVERFKANYKDYAYFSYEELTNYLTSHPNVYETGEETFNYYRFNAVKPCRLRTKYIIGLRYTFSSVQMFGTAASAAAASSSIPGAEKYSPQHNLITDAEHPSNHQRFEAEATGTRRRARPSIPKTTTQPTTTTTQRRGGRGVGGGRGGRGGRKGAGDDELMSQASTTSSARTSLTGAALESITQVVRSDRRAQPPPSRIPRFLSSLPPRPSVSASSRKRKMSSRYEEEEEEDDVEEEEEEEYVGDSGDDSPVTARDRRLGLLGAKRVRPPPQQQTMMHKKKKRNRLFPFAEDEAIDDPVEEEEEEQEEDDHTNDMDAE
jgi:hypothetical protein